MSETLKRSLKQLANECRDAHDLAMLRVEGGKERSEYWMGRAVMAALVEAKLWELIDETYQGGA